MTLEESMQQLETRIDQLEDENAAVIGQIARLWRKVHDLQDQITDPGERLDPGFILLSVPRRRTKEIKQ